MERFGEDALGLMEELEGAGIDPRGFGQFGTVPELGIEPSTFDYERAAPILIKWLPRVRTPGLKELIARSLAGEPTAVGGAEALVREFRGAPPSEWSLKWAIGNTLSSIADADLANDLIGLLQDRSHGLGRQMLCEALRKTGDPRAPAVLIDLIGDPDVAGHAIAALRNYGPKSSLPHLRRARPALEHVVDDASATDFARRMAKKALERLDASSGH
jgi:hypothetical protein